MTDRFGKVHGPGFSAEQLLRERVVDLEATVAARDKEMFRRSMPTLGHLADALNGMAQRAQAGDHKAKATLQEFFKYFDGARAAAQAITVVRNQ